MRFQTERLYSQIEQLANKLDHGNSNFSLGKKSTKSFQTTDTLNQKSLSQNTKFITKKEDVDKDMFYEDLDDDNNDYLLGKRKISSAFTVIKRKEEFSSNPSRKHHYKRAKQNPQRMTKSLSIKPEDYKFSTSPLVQLNGQINDALAVEYGLFENSFKKLQEAVEEKIFQEKNFSQKNAFEENELRMIDISEFLTMANRNFSKKRSYSTIDHIRNSYCKQTNSCSGCGVLSPVFDSIEKKFLDKKNIRRKTADENEIDKLRIQNKFLIEVLADNDMKSSANVYSPLSLGITGNSYGVPRLVCDMSDNSVRINVDEPELEVPIPNNRFHQSTTDSEVNNNRDMESPSFDQHGSPMNVHTAPKNDYGDQKPLKWLQKPTAYSINEDQCTFMSYGGAR